MSSDKSVKLEEARKELSEKLLDHFSIASGGPVHAIGASRKNNCVNVYITRQPTEEEKPNFPEQYKGVDVRYIVSPPARLV